MAWEKIDEMFPDDEVLTNQNGYITKKDIKDNNLPFIHLTLIKPVRSMRQNQEEIVWFPNGEMARYYSYNVFPQKCIDGKSLFNTYGQVVYNRLMKFQDIHKQIDYEEKLEENQKIESSN